jgi:hypothetical protein
MASRIGWKARVVLIVPAKGSNGVENRPLDRVGDLKFEGRGKSQTKGTPRSRGLCGFSRRDWSFKSVAWEILNKGHLTRNKVILSGTKGME